MHRTTKLVVSLVLHVRTPHDDIIHDSVLEAVDVPHQRHKVNELMLPTKGPRSHASEASGSDFDGDTYFAIWDKDLVTFAIAVPMDYKAPIGIVDVVGPEVLHNHKNRQLQVSMNNRASMIVELLLDCEVGTIVMRIKLAWRKCHTTLTTLFLNAFFSYQSKVLSQLFVIAELRSLFC